MSGPGAIGRPFTRRRLLQGVAGLEVAALLGPSGRLIGFVSGGEAADAAAAGPAAADAARIGAWLAIAPDGGVTITVAKSDMGQGVRTGLAMIVAEELDADWEAVTVAQAPAGDAWGSQFTVGSGSTSGQWGTLRGVGAAARAVLVAAAAARWGVPPEACRTEAGVVHHDASGRRATYGELAAAAAALPLPAANGLPLKRPEAFRIIGRPTPRVDNAAVVTGRAIYAQDVTPAGAHYAVLARPPVFGARLAGSDEAAARAVPGVTDVVAVEGKVAVVGTSTWAAIAGRDALAARWDLGANADLAFPAIEADLWAAAGDLPPAAGEPDGVTAELRLTFPFLAHVPMEPMNAVADVRAEGVTVWAPTQGPQQAAQTAAQAAGVTPDRVTLHVTLLGGGFGRRADSDFVREAVLVSKAAGVPIKLLWTRDDDIRGDAYRPASVHALRGTVGADGRILAWRQRLALASGGGRGLAGQAAPVYAVPTPDIVGAGIRTPVPTFAWRSVNNSQLNPANEILMDALAAAAGRDPLAFRLAHLDDARLRAVLERAAAAADWTAPLPPGRGRGIAAFSGYGSRIAQVVELSVAPDGQVRVHRVVAAVDPGVAVNPLSIRAQVEGASLDGLSTALGAAVTIRDGRAAETSFFDYRLFRLPDVPAIEVHILEGANQPGGMGEVGYPAMPAAVANAVFAAAGVRIARFPIAPADLAGAVAPGATATPGPTPAPTAAPAPTRAHRVYVPSAERP